MCMLNKIMNTSTLSKTVNWTERKNKASAIRNCSMLRLLTLPSAGYRSTNRSNPFVMHKGVFYPYKVIHNLWVTFNLFLEKIFKFFQNIFPIQVYRIYNRTQSNNLVIPRFVKTCIVFYSINFISSSHIKTRKRQLLLIPWVIHKLWIIFSQLSNPSAYLLADFYIFYSKF